MREFFNVLAPDMALDLLLAKLELRMESEVVAVRHALARVTFAKIASPEDLPSFPRSTMDGYSVRASDTFGATESLPAYLEVAGEVNMGEAPDVGLSEGEAAGAYTGGMLARGADAVVMVENTQAVDGSTIEVLRPVAQGENVVQVGEDVRAGGEVLPAGHVLRPQDIGGILALGIMEVEVARRPRMAIVSTGDELVPPEAVPGPGQVRDINTYTVSALAEQAGGVPVPIGLVGDDFEAQRAAGTEGLSRGDLLVFSAGSSVSSRDMTAEVIGSLGSPGVLVHGIAHKPGKPTIVAMVEGKPVFGLPGNPVSAVDVFQMLVRPSIYALCGCDSAPQPRTVTARLTQDVASVAGREDHVRVRLLERDGTLCAEPVFGKSNLVYTLVRSDGVITVPLDKGGLYAGEDVEVRVS